MGFALPFLPKGHRFFNSFIYNKNLFYNGKTMPNLILPTRALEVVKRNKSVSPRWVSHCGRRQNCEETEVTK